MSAKTLRSQYLEAVRKYRYSQAEMLAMQDEANVRLTKLYDVPYGNLNYKQIYEKGIYRVRNGQTIHYTGDEAVKIQLTSLKSQTSKRQGKQQFIENYAYAMEQVGYVEGEIEMVVAELEKIPATELAIMAKNGMFPDIQFLYVDKRGSSAEEIVQLIRSSRLHFTPENRRNVRENAKIYNQLLKRQIAGL